MTEINDMAGNVSPAFPSWWSWLLLSCSFSSDNLSSVPSKLVNSACLMYWFWLG